MEGSSSDHSMLGYLMGSAHTEGSSSDHSMLGYLMGSAHTEGSSSVAIIGSSG